MIPETPKTDSNPSRRITLRNQSNDSQSTTKENYSIVLPLANGNILDLDPSLDPSLLKKEIGHEARQAVVKQLSQLLKGMDD